MKQPWFFCIDMKCFYASVECAERGLNPFETNLVVADVTRGKNALCLAISPRMKALGVRNRCRLSEIPPGTEYIIAPPRMQLYIEYAADIYGIYLNYFAPEDMHVYSIDECFIDATRYMSGYQHPRELAGRLMNLIAEGLHIPSTAGIGTNLYLAKVALDITAKHAPDHMGLLTEELYREQLWEHRPITDFWGIAKGKSARLEKCGILTMGDVARAPVELLCKLFGVDAELLIDHAWGRESCTMADIKSYRSKNHSVSFSQILPRDYSADEARTVLREMILHGTQELMRRGVISARLSIGIGYSKGVIPWSHGSVRLDSASASEQLFRPRALSLYDTLVQREYKIRQLGLSFEDTVDESCQGYDFFTDWESVEREKAREKAVLALQERYGRNAVLRGTSLLPEGTQRERNGMIGGHRAGYDDKTGKSKTVHAL